MAKATVDQVQETKKLAETVTPVKPKTKEMEALLTGGYGMTLAEAKQIIKERDENPLTHPYAIYQKAKAYVAAYEGNAKVVAPNKGWKRDTE